MTAALARDRRSVDQRRRIGRIARERRDDRMVIASRDHGDVMHASRMPCAHDPRDEGPPLRIRQQGLWRAHSSRVTGRQNDSGEHGRSYRRDA